MEQEIPYLVRFLLGEDAREVLDVAARHEVVAGTSKHDTPYRVVALETMEGGVQAGAHVRREGVARFGPVHGECGDAVGDIDQQVGHGFCSFWVVGSYRSSPPHPKENGGRCCPVSMSRAT